MVDHYTPEPDRDAGSRTMIEMIRTFQAMGYIVKFWPANHYLDPHYAPPLQRMGVEVLYGPYERSLDDWLKENGRELDVTLLSRPRELIAALGPVRRHTLCDVLYYGHDLHFARQQREAEIMQKPEKAKGARKLFEIERTLWRSVDATLYPSQDEIDEVLKFEPGAVAFAMPAYCFDRSAERTTVTEGARIVFVAGFAHPPNVDAAVWFVQEVFPLVLAARPDARLSLVGSNPTEEVQALASEWVEVTGWISSEELKARYDSARVAVVPLRFGAGVKLKVVEALNEGVPLVTTPAGAQGLAGLADIAAVCEAPEVFAGETLKLLNAGDDTWLRASHSGAAFVQSRFGRPAMRAVLEGAIEAAKVHRAGRAAAQLSTG